MYEWLNASDEIRGRYVSERDALTIFQELSVPGDYVWDTDNGVVLIAHVTDLIEDK